MVEASLMLEDPSFLIENWDWEGSQPVRAVSQWEDATYQVLSGCVPFYQPLTTVGRMDLPSSPVLLYNCSNHPKTC